MNLNESDLNLKNALELNRESLRLDHLATQHETLTQLQACEILDVNAIHVQHS